MKDIKNYLVNEAQSYKFKDIKYTMISYYDNPSWNEEPKAFLIEDISEISDIYYDWDFESKYIDKIIEKVKKLNVNECYVNKSGKSDFEVISRIK